MKVDLPGGRGEEGGGVGTALCGTEAGWTQGQGCSAGRGALPAQACPTPPRSAPGTPVEYWPSSSTEGFASKSPSDSSGLVWVVRVAWAQAGEKLV